MYEDLELEKKKYKSLFGDDMTRIITKISYTNLFRIFESFGECSGLKVNKEKTEIILLGHNSLVHEEDSQNTVVVNLSKFWVYIFWL